MRIERVLTAAGLAGFYNDDIDAIRGGARPDGFTYRGEPRTPGFTAVRQPGEALSVLLVLEDGDVVHGDCAVAQYVGVGGRETPMTAAAMAEVVERVVTPALEGRELGDFRTDAGEIDRLEDDRGRLPASVRYGVTQALLAAVARARRVTMAEVILSDYDLEAVLEPVLLNVQSGDDRYANVDKMIMKRADIIPHGLINNVEDKLGRDGRLFLDYVTWVRDRVHEIGAEDYAPIFRFDVYGCIGAAFDDDLTTVTDYLLDVEERCRPFPVLMEMPIDLGTNAAQLEGMRELRHRLRERGSGMRLIVDEYANTLEDIREWVDEGGADIVHVKTIDLGGIDNVVEAVLYCKQNDVLAYQGGTCNETDRSAQVCVNLAVATQPFAMLAKPGMGLDEGMMIVHNEQQRLLTLLRHKAERGLLGRAATR